jgi:hypothetical protein
LYLVNQQVVDAVNAELRCFSEPALNMLVRAATTLVNCMMRCRNRPMTARANPTTAWPGRGGGWLRLNLMRNFDDPESARVVFVSDLDLEKLTLVRRRHAGVEVTTELLPTDPRVDAVAIVTAVPHYEAALAALASMCWSTSGSTAFLCNPVT